MPNDAQYLFPDADISNAGGWSGTGANAWSVLDEYPFSDADYIGKTNVTGSGDVIEVGLTSATDPARSTVHVIRYRWTWDYVGGGSPSDGNLSFQLIQGTTVIATSTITGVIGATAELAFVDGTYTLTSGEANSITDYSDLRIRITATKTSGARQLDIYVSGCFFHCPQPEGVFEGGDRHLFRSPVNNIPYYVRRDAGGEINVYKGNAVTPTSFTAQDTSNNPSNDAYGNPCGAMGADGLLRLLYFQKAGSTASIRTAVFNTNSDTFTVTDTSISSISATGTWTWVNSSPTCAIYIDRVGTAHIAYLNAVPASSRDDVQYRQLPQGGSWSSPVTVNDTSTTNPRGHISVNVDADGYPVVAFIEGGSLIRATSTSIAPSSFSRTTLTSGASIAVSTQKTSIVVDPKGGSIWVSAVVSGAVVAYEGTTARSTGSAGVTPSLFVQTSNDEKVGVIYEDSSDDIVYRYWNSSGGSWDSPTTLETGTYTHPVVEEKTYDSIHTTNWSGTGSTNDAFGQSFTGNGKRIRRMLMPIRNESGDPPTSGTIDGNIYAHTGTFGTNGTPTGSPLAGATIPYDRPVTNVWWWHRWAFNYATTNGTNYFFCVEKYDNGTVAKGSRSTNTDGNDAWRNTAGAGWTSGGSDRALRVLTEKDPHYLFNNAGTIDWGEIVGLASYTITVDVGSYAVTGTAVSLLWNHIITASGSYSYTGTDVTLTKGKTITVDAGSYAYTGTDVTLRRGYTITASGSYSYSGTDVALLRGYPLTVDAGSYAYTGADVGLLWNRIVTASGSYAYTGTDVTLNRGYVITASGSYAYTGTDVTFTKGKAITVESGSYAYTGTDVVLKRGYVITASGSYSYTGTDVGLLWNRILPITKGDYSYDGTAVGLLWNRIVTASGSYAYTGADVALKRGYIITASGSYAYTGTDVALLRGYPITVSGSYTYTGTDVTLRRGYVITASGSYSYTGTDVTLTYTPVGAFTIVVESGSYAYTGTDVTLRRTFIVTASGSYSYTGADVALLRGYPITVSGSYVYTGTDVTLVRGYSITVSGSYVYTGTDVTLTYTPIGSYTIVVESGSYAYTGTDVTLRRGYIITASGSYSYTGTDVTLNYGYVIVVEAGSYAYVGTDIALKQGLIISVSGSYSYAGTDVGLERGYIVSVSGSYAYTGTDVGLLWNRVLPVQGGTYNYTGTSIQLVYSGVEVVIIPQRVISVLQTTGQTRSRKVIDGSVTSGLSSTGKTSSRLTETGKVFSEGE